MKNETDKQKARRIKIEQAAYELLARKGYKATSMLAIAKHASASNQTLYRWYQNKQSLFCALVKENARETRELLEHNIETDTDPMETLQKIGPLLLRLVTSEKAIVLNRAAVGDVYDTGTLGKVIKSAGKGTVFPLIVKVMEMARDKGLMTFENASDAAEIYTSVLLGDLQLQRVIGVRGPLSEKVIKARTARALGLMLRLFGADDGSFGISVRIKH